MVAGAGKRAARGVDLNILPEKMRRTRVEVTTPSLAGLGATFWLLVVLAALLLVPLYQFQGQAQAGLAKSQAALRALDAEVQARKAVPAEAQQLRAALTQTVQLSWGLDADYESMVQGKALLAGGLEAIRSSVPAGIDLVSLTQKGTQVSVHGRGDSATVVLFANNLKKTGKFTSVTVGSLAETLMPTPSPTLEPGVTPSATPVRVTQPPPPAAPTNTPQPTATFTPILPTPTGTILPPSCQGDESMWFTPGAGVVGSPVAVAVTSAKAHSDVRLSVNGGDVGGVSVTSGGRGYIWTWTVVPGAADRYFANFYVGFSVLCTANDFYATAGVATATPTQALTATPTRTPTTAPTATPTTVPTSTPTSAPTSTPTTAPTATPTTPPTATPTFTPRPTPTTGLAALTVGAGRGGLALPSWLMASAHWMVSDMSPGTAGDALPADQAPVRADFTIVVELKKGVQ